MSIDVRTDSPATPIVTLRLRVLGFDPPPFLASVAGNLIFRDFESGSVGEIQVTTVEPSEASVSDAQFESDLPFLRFRRQESIIRPVGSSSAAFARTTRYAVEITSPPPEDTFLGEIRVSDPRRPDDVKTLLVRGEKSPPIRIVPSRSIIRAADDLSRQSKSFVVVTRGPNDDAAVHAMPTGEDNPFLVESRGIDPSVGAARYMLRWKPGVEVRPGIYSVDVTVSFPSGPQSARLSIFVPEDSP